MPRRQGEGPSLRQQAADTLIDCDLTIDAIGGLVSGALESHVTNCFALADDLLADGSSPRNWVRNGVAAWIQCFETQVRMYRGICTQICRPPHRRHPPAGKIENGVLTFTVSVDAEDADPVATGIPPGAAVGASAAGPLAPYLRLSLSDDGKTVFAGLVGLGDGGAFRTGVRKTLTATISWNGGVPPNGGTLPVVATRLPRRPAIGG